MAGDVAELLGWESEGDGDESRCLSRAQRQRALQLHRETETALQIGLAHLGQAVRPGLYVQRDRYRRRSWTPGWAPAETGEQP